MQSENKLSFSKEDIHENTCTLKRSCLLSNSMKLNIGATIDDFIQLRFYNRGSCDPIFGSLSSFAANGFSKFCSINVFDRVHSLVNTEERSIFKAFLEKFV